MAKVLYLLYVPSEQKEKSKLNKISPSNDLDSIQASVPVQEAATKNENSEAAIKGIGMYIINHFLLSATRKIIVLYRIELMN